MDSKQQSRLNYTEDFSVACRINGINCDEMLQYFINKVSFYVYNGGEMDAAAMMATRIILECKEEKGSKLEPLTDKKVKRLFLKHILLLSKLADNSHLSTLEKIQESYYLMEEWAQEAMPLVNYETTLPVEEGFVSISFDFNLLCKINGLEIITPLQYFIDRMSLAVDRAVRLHHDVQPERSMALLEMRIMATNRSAPIISTEIHERYMDKLKDLDGWLSDVDDVEVRIKAYRNLYREWCEMLYKQLD